MPGLVLTCEHASWRLPPDVDLGVADDVLQSQASWDHGALAIAEQLAAATGIGVHAGAFSRMYVDLNRPRDHANVIPAVSYGAPVPGNTHVTAADRSARLELFHAPYWHAVRSEVAARLRDRGACLHLSSHSFAPELDPANRRFDVGVLYDPSHVFEAALAEQLLFALRGAGLDVRANEPYTGIGPALCTALRIEHRDRSYAGIELETSHAVTHTRDGCARVAAAVIPLLTSVQAS